MTSHSTQNGLTVPAKSMKFGLRSIGTRLFVAVISAASIGLGSLGYLFYSELKSVRILQLTSETDNKVRHLDAELLSGETFLKSLVSATIFLHDSGVRSPEAYEKLVLSFMSARPKLITGFGVMQFPKGLVDREWFGPYIEESVPDRGVTLAQNPKFTLVDLWAVDQYPKMQYFKDAVKADRYLWSEPYMNDNYPIPLMTFSGTIRNQKGQLIAVMNGDINIDDLNKDIDASDLNLSQDDPSFNSNGYHALITKNGQLLSYSLDPRQAAQMANVSSIPSLKPVWEQIRYQINQGIEKSHFESDSIYWVYQTVPRTQWVMLEAIPYETVAKPALLGAISATIIAAVFLLLVVWLFIQFLNRRLQPILDVCDRTIGDHRDINNSGDEISHLSDVFFNMVNQQQTLLRKLQTANSQLAQSNRLKDNFLATMSHELRTPLNTILGVAEILQEGIFGGVNKQQHKALENIEKSGAHLLALINDILDIAKIESEFLELNCTTVAIGALCASSVAFIQPQAEQKNIRLETNLSPNLPDLYIDERRIRQVLLNLLNNAFKFTPEGGHITLEVTCQKEESEDEADKNGELQKYFVRISITDTGIGIAPEDIKRLFQPFVQIDSALNRKYEGTGLGLALVKRIVELHGGRVGLTSEVNVGSCFTIDLPYIETRFSVGREREGKPNLQKDRETCTEVARE